MGHDNDIIQILIVSPFCTWKYKHEFIDIDQDWEANVNGTSACISQNKTKKRLVFDLLTCYLFIFLLLFFPQLS